MTASVNILRGDLHLLVSTALNRGRYVLMTDGDGQPLEITLDLKERADDLFGTEQRPFSSVEEMWAAGVPVERMVSAFDWVGNSSPGRLNAAQPSDDHGPTIPAQPVWTGVDLGAGRDVSVYEFALQDADKRFTTPSTLAEVQDGHAPDMNAFHAADWVHVYDRVTRERRTLKRPEPDAVLTGLRDVAADLRKPKPPYATGDHVRVVGGSAPFPHPNGKHLIVTAVDLEGRFLGFSGDKDGAVWDMSRFELVSTPMNVERGAPVDPPFGCAALPPVGPLTSTEGLRAGDVLFHPDPDFGPVRFRDAMSRSVDVEAIRVPGRGLAADYSEFAFVGRPDALGWMTWAGGENPVPGAVVKVIFRDGQHLEAASDNLDTFWPNKDGDEAVDRFQIVDTPPAV